MKIKKKLKHFIKLLAWILLFAINSISYSTEEYISNSMLQHVYPRSIGFGFLRFQERIDRVTEFLEHNDMVQGYTLYPMVSGNFEQQSFSMGEYMPEVLSDFMSGECLSLAENEVIMSRYFATETEGDTSVVDMKSYIGKTIDIEIPVVAWNCMRESDEESKIFKVKVVGVYDNIQAGESNRIYVNTKQMREMVLYRNDVRKGDEKRGELLSSVGTGDATVVLKNYKDIDVFYEKFSKILEDYEEVTLEFEEGPIQLEASGVIIKKNGELELCRQILVIIAGIVNFVAMILLIGVLVDAVYQIKSELKKRYQEIGIMKAIGYKNTDISLLYLKKYVKMIIQELVLSLAGGMLLAEFFERWLKRNADIFAGTDLSVHIGGIIMLAVGIFAATMLGFFIEMWNIRKISPMEALKSVD